MAHQNKYPHEYAHAEELLQKPYLKQYEVERICRIYGINAREAVRELQPYKVSERHYQYDSNDVKQFINERN